MPKTDGDEALMNRYSLIPAGAVFLASCLASADGNAGELTAEERRIERAARKGSADALRLLEEVVRIPSATENLDGVRKVGAVFRAEFDRIGFQTRWVELPPEMKRAGHLVAEHPGGRGSRLLLIGHLDTVLDSGHFDREGSKARGSGALDMKGGDVILLHALKALHAAGALEDRRVIVVLTGDEEDPGVPLEVSRAALQEAADRSDVALAFEAVVDDTATVARRGVSTWELKVEAKTGHSSGIFSPTLGSGAIFEAARILDGFRRELAGQPDLTFNPSLIVGGTEVEHDPARSRGSASGKSNVIPAAVSVQGDLRFIDDAQRERAKEAMRAIVAGSLDEASASIRFKDEYPAMAPRPGNYEILKVLDAVSRDLGMGGVKALPPGERGAGDISFVASKVAGLDGLGASGSGSHAPGETVDLDSIEPQIVRAALLIHRLTR